MNHSPVKKTTCSPIDHFQNDNIFFVYFQLGRTSYTASYGTELFMRFALKQNIFMKKGREYYRIFFSKSAVLFLCTEVGADGRK